jgi:hypothetical protein
MDFRERERGQRVRTYKHIHLIDKPVDESIEFLEK